jgi:glycolate oxidase
VGGSISGEHGVGSDKRCYMDWMYGGDDLATMLLVRQALNPDGLANPDKQFPTPRTCSESVRRVQVLQAEGTSLPAEALVF